MSDTIIFMAYNNKETITFYLLNIIMTINNSCWIFDFISGLKLITKFSLHFDTLKVNIYARKHRIM